MPKSYRHLTHEDRCQIYALKRSGLSHREAKKLIFSKHFNGFIAYGRWL